MTRNFLGIPVEGDIVRVLPRTTQRPLEELQPLLLAVVNDPNIMEFGWTQYTPYFNDGEPCEFTIHHPWFRTPADVKEVSSDEDEEDEDEEELWTLEIDQHPVLGTRVWNDQTRNFMIRELDPKVAETSQRCQQLDAALTSGEFEDVLLEAFGDHAEIKVRRDGIQQKFYSHD